MSESYIYPNWPLWGPAKLKVRACITTRLGGHSLPPYDSFNLGLHVGDDFAAVTANRAQLQEVLPNQPVWLNQVHGVTVFDADQSNSGAVPTADAAVTVEPNRVLAIMTADCLPILLCDQDAKVVGIAHAGWRGLSAGVIEQTVSEMLKKLGGGSSGIYAYLGPAIGPTVFEVGDDVVQAFDDAGSQKPESAFRPIEGRPGKYLADIYQLARERLSGLGISKIAGADHCTVKEDQDFFSYRRDGKTGRFATFIWISK